MRPSVDVWVRSKHAAGLQPPSRSIVDGGPGVVTVRPCVLRRPGEPGLQVSLTVDEETAESLARACRWQTRWERRVAPIGLIAAGLIFVAGMAGVLRQDSGLALAALVLSLVLAVGLLVGWAWMRSLASRHHPVRQGRNHVLIRDVHPETAREWAGLNPAGGIVIKDR